MKALLLVLALGLAFAAGIYLGRGHGPAPAMEPLAREAENAIIPLAPPAVESPVMGEWASGDTPVSGHDSTLHGLQSRLHHDAQDRAAWRELAELHQRQGDLVAAQDAWFRYLDLEWDALAREEALDRLHPLLAELASDRANAGNPPDWLLRRLEDLLGLGGPGGEVHLLLAELHLAREDSYQAQYHALMATDFPDSQARAERLLARLQGAPVSDTLTLPLSRLGAQFVVNVTLDGYQARLLLDTGASLSGLSDHYTSRHPALVRASRPIRLNTASGPVDSLVFRVDRLQLGPVHFDNQAMALLPMGDVREFDGLLGVDILGRFDFVIDQDTPALLLKPRTR